MQALALLILIGAVGGSYDFDQDDLTIGEVVRLKIETVVNKTFPPNWFDLDTRILPMWYDQAKIGIMLHWGVYSVPAYHSEWIWKYWMDPDLPRQPHEDIKKFMEQKYLRKHANFKYQDFAPMFKAEKFEPDILATKLRNAGAKYVILTAKHHDGFALFPSEASKNWNSKDVGPHRDLVGELGLAIRKQYLIFGVQYSLYEWFNPTYLHDREYGFKNNTYVMKKVIPELKSIVNRYGPTVLRADGDWEASSSYWNAEEFLAWLYNHSPVRHDVVVNDRWGRDAHCKHGDVYGCVDKFNPNKHKWENAFSLDTKSWGYRKNMNLQELLPMKEVLERIADTVSTGGNVLINIGLTAQGKIPDKLEKKLQVLGNWLRINGEAIYNTAPWYYQTDPSNQNVRYTCNKLQYNSLRPTAVPRKTDNITAIYAIFFVWPDKNKLRLRAVTETFRKGSYIAEMLGVQSLLKWTMSKGKVFIELPDKFPGNNAMTLDLAWVLKFVEVEPRTNSIITPKISTKHRSHVIAEVLKSNTEPKTQRQQRLKVTPKVEDFSERRPQIYAIPDPLKKDETGPELPNRKPEVQVNIIGPEKNPVDKYIDPILQPMSEKEIMDTPEVPSGPINDPQSDAVIDTVVTKGLVDRKSNRGEEPMNSKYVKQAMNQRGVVKFKHVSPTDQSMNEGLMDIME